MHYHGDRMPPIRVAFEIPYFTVSGSQVPMCCCLDSIFWASHCRT